MRVTLVGYYPVTPIDTPKIDGFEGNTSDATGLYKKKKTSFYAGLSYLLDWTGFFLAEVDENRTHQGRDTPRIGFEDREPHQRTNYLRNKLWGFYVYWVISSI